MKRLVGVCSLCGYEYSGWFDWPATEAHMLARHGLVFDRGDIANPPQWRHAGEGP